MFKSISRVFILLLGLLCGLGSPAFAAAVPDSAALAAAAALALDQLEAKAELGGEVPVIVELRTATLPTLEPPMDQGGDPGRAERKLRDRASLVARAQDRLATAVADHPARINRFRYLPLAALHADRAAIRRLRQLPEVLSITEDRPHPPLLNHSVPRIGGNLAYAQGYTGAGQTVAIIDTGVQTTHPFFAGRVLNAYEACFSASSIGSGSGVATGSGVADIVSLCPNLAACPGTFVYPENTACGAGAGFTCAASGPCWHGTHVAGIVLGSDSTYRGVAPGASLIPIQVFLTENGSLVAYDSDIIAGLQHVLTLSQSHADLHIASVNMSLGGDLYTSTLACNADSAATKTAIDALRAAGIATVIAAGNNSDKTGISTPGCISSAVSVGATDNSDAIAYFSNLATALSVFAPGVGVYSAVPTNAVGGAGGTSMATPHVTGAFAVLRQKTAERLLSPSVDNLLAALRLSGTPITNSGNNYSTPRIQIDQALALIDTQGSLPVELIMDSQLASTGITTVSGSFASVTDTNAYGGTALRATGTDRVNAIRFAPNLPTNGFYAVSAWWPVITGNTASGQVEIVHADGVDSFLVDQTASVGQWNPIAAFRFQADGSARVTVAGDSAAKIVADAIRFEYLGVDPPPPQIDTIYLAIGEIGLYYRDFLSASGGVGRLLWAVVDGVLPPGLMLDPETGEINGTPTRLGAFPVRIQVADVIGHIDTLVAKIDVVPLGSRLNFAAQANGGVASASSYGSTWLPAGANDGQRKIVWNGSTGTASGVWADGTPGVFPDWLQITFAGSRAIQEIDVITQQDTYQTPIEPTLDTTFSLYGNAAFDVQYWTGSDWSMVPGGSVTGNTRVWRRFSFAPITTTAVRVRVNSGGFGMSRIVELEAWAVAAAGNVAPTVSLTAPQPNQTYTAPATLTLAAEAADSDGTLTRVEFYADATLIATAAAAPYSVTWANVPAGDYVLTAKAYDNAGAVRVSAAVAVTVMAGGSTPINVAAQANGGVASASSYGSTWLPAGANDGNRKSVWNGSTVSGVWADGTGGVFPDWLQITFAGSRTIQEIDVITQQDTYQTPIEPTLDTTFSLYGNTAFDVQYWTGSDWSTVPGGNVTGNNRVWRRFSFAPITTTAVRVRVTSGGFGMSRIVELEAWAAAAAGNVAPTVSLTVPQPNQTYTAPATLTLAAEAADSDGTLTRVEFYADATLIATAAAAPYSVTWANVPVGDYVLTAKAYDNAGAVTVSAAVAVTVTASGSIPINVAVQANGGIASASSYGSTWLPAGANDGNRKSVWNGSTVSGVWADGTGGVFPDWLQITFAGSRAIQEIDVITQQDTYQTPIEPTLDTTFSLYGNTAFDVQYWTGSDWSTVPGGSVTGNDRVWRRFSFAPITTTAVRVRVNSGGFGLSRIIELEAYTITP